MKKPTIFTLSEAYALADSLNSLNDRDRYYDVNYITDSLAKVAIFDNDYNFIGYW